MKNIVLCCDGTGNADTGVPSNVKRLYDLLQAGAEQMPTYYRGVGSEPRQPHESWFGYHAAHLRSLGFGHGVAEALLGLYSTLVAQYEEGDLVFCFGFSRGAFTVRALAGLVHVCGLVQREHAGRAAEALRLYEGSEFRITEAVRARGWKHGFPPADTDHARLDDLAREFKRTYSRPCQIHFLGLWDTVKAYGWVNPRSFPALRHNASVKTVRHAPALDERRALFQVTGWAAGHRDAQEVWFAGDHSDVGGGHRTGNSALADASLRWMLGEAVTAGLRLAPHAASCVALIEAGAAKAPATPPRSLFLSGGFFLLDCLLRRELDNTQYPPLKKWRLLWLNGARKPGDHRVCGTVLVHHTVMTRKDAGERRYAIARLVRRSKRWMRRAGTIDITVTPVPDLAISSHATPASSPHETDCLHDDGRRVDASRGGEQQIGGDRPAGA